MLNYYEINDSTLLLIPEKEKITRVVEANNEFYVAMSVFNIIDESCKNFGSSYYGRHEGTKKMLGFKYKTPIIVSEINNIIFFPTIAPKETYCVWISQNNIEKYRREGNIPIITFKNNKDYEPAISYYIIENQIYKATMLEAKLKKLRK